ncbi:MAG: hypothetical protein GY774_23870 [Planctomycetes bacterium]|nr:hypothetical protein [Planctomycetota bacterium]
MNEMKKTIERYRRYHTAKLTQSVTRNRDTLRAWRIRLRVQSGAGAAVILSLTLAIITLPSLTLPLIALFASISLWATNVILLSAIKISALNNKEYQTRLFGQNVSRHHLTKESAGQTQYY